MEDVMIAMVYFKITIDDNKFLFIPTGVVRGKEIDEGLFDAEDGQLYYSIEDESCCDKFYFFPAYLESLKKEKGYESDSDCISLYKDNHFKNIFYGFYDYNGKYRTFKLSLDSIQNKVEVGNILRDNKDQSDLELTNDDLKSSIEDVIDSLDLEQLEYTRQYIEEVYNSLKEELVEEKEENNEIVKVDLKEIREKLKKIIIAQDEAVDDITRAIAINLVSDNPRLKSNILIVGPTGTGKTELVKTLSKILDIPFVREDATKFTKSGWHGSDLDEVFAALLEKTHGNVEKAQRGIIFLDEIDKKFVQDEKDPGGKGFIDSMLVVLDGENRIVKIGNDYNQNQVLFDTSHLTFVFAGAFQSLYDKQTRNSIGFGKSLVSLNNLGYLTKDDLLKNGVPAEFLGRISTLTQTVPFTFESFKSLLLTSKISPLKDYEELFNSMGIKLIFSEEFIDYITNKALRSNLGARGLRSEIGDYLKTYIDGALIGEAKDEIIVKAPQINKEKVYKK